MIKLGVPNEETDLTCAVIIGQAASPSAARDIAITYRLCPYSAFYNAEGATVVGILVLPRNKRWWAKLPQKTPHLLGFEKANVLFSDVIFLQSPWSLKEVKPVQEVSPCGAKCPDCPYYQSSCEGCPTTIWFTGS